MKGAQSIKSTYKALFCTALAAAVAALIFGGGMDYVLSSVSSRPRALISPVTTAEPTTDAYETLERYAGSLEPTEALPKAAANSSMLPDVDTMIQKLAARLETSPEDIRGWRMLGWSYFQVARYDQAAAAYARAMRIEPTSAELKALFEEAQARIERADDAVANSGGKGASQPDRPSTSEHMRSNDAEIRSMVDRLADRLRQSPQDLEGWIQLIRSRVVLGDKPAATKSIQDAAEAFNGNVAASTRIAALAMELGLKAE